MAVALLCPKCQSALPLKVPIPSVCSKCGEEFPDTLITAATNAANSHPPVPIQVGKWLATLIAAMIIFGLASAPFDWCKYTIDGQQVSGSEFLRVAGIPFALISAL